MRKLLRTGSVPARAWRGQAAGIGPTERLKLRRQIAAAAAGKKESVTLSLYMEVNNLEVEEELSTMSRLLGRKASSWEDGEESNSLLGGRRSLKYKHRDR